MFGDHYPSIPETKTAATSFGSELVRVEQHVLQTEETTYRSVTMEQQMPPLRMCNEQESASYSDFTGSKRFNGRNSGVSTSEGGFSSFSDALRTSAILPAKPHVQLCAEDIFKPREQDQNDQFEADPFPIEELPRSYCKYTSFSTVAFPFLIVSHLLYLLREIFIVDFAYQRETHTITGTAYQGYRAAKFEAQIFKGYDQYVVEFRFLRGCKEFFSGFYKEVKQSCLVLLDGGSICVQSVAPQSHPPSPASSPITSPSSSNPARNDRTIPLRRPFDPRQPCDIVMTESCLQILIDMASSMMVDVALQGMQAIAMLSDNARNHVLLCKHMKLWERALSSPDEDIIRYSAYILSNLTTSSQEARTLLVSPQWLGVLFSTLSKSCNNEISRQVARCLVNLCQTQAKQLAAEQQYIQLLVQQRKCSDDRRFQSLCDAALGRIAGHA